MLGNLTKQTDARGNIIDLEYDNLNRIKKQIIDDSKITDYTYVTTGYGLGQVKEIIELKLSKLQLMKSLQQDLYCYQIGIKKRASWILCVVAALWRLKLL